MRGGSRTLLQLLDTHRRAYPRRYGLERHLDADSAPRLAPGATPRIPTVLRSGGHIVGREGTTPAVDGDSEVYAGKPGDDVANTCFTLAIHLGVELDSSDTGKACLRPN